ncbi:hypothetical protein [Micromonospora endolithica]|nr:hypothetical protein [Micromonospora endolithica]
MTLMAAPLATSLRTFAGLIAQVQADLHEWAAHNAANNVVVQPDPTTHTFVVQLHARTSTLATAVYLAERAVLNAAATEQTSWRVEILRAAAYPLVTP